MKKCQLDKWEEISNKEKQKKEKFLCKSKIFKKYEESFFKNSSDKRKRMKPKVEVVGLINTAEHKKFFLKLYHTLELRPVFIYRNVFRCYNNSS